MRREKKKKFLPGAPLRIMVGLVLAIGIGTLIYNGFYRVNEPVGSIPVPTPAGEEITNTPEPNEAPETNETEGVIDMEFVVEVPAERIGELADARVTFQGISRVFTYYVPSNFTPGDTLPLMITLHGRAFNAESQLLESQFHELAEREGFILVAPNCVTIDGDGNLASEGYTFRDLPGVDPLNIRWNANFPLHNSRGVDDVAYLGALMDYFIEQFGVDENRIFLSGLSNGALMSMMLVSEISERIAGVGAVAGIVPYAFMHENISGPLKLVFINGDQDPTVNIRGVPGHAPSLHDTAAWFYEHFGGTGEATVTYLPQIAEDDPTQIIRHEWPEVNGSQVILYVIEGGGHTWPGGTQFFPEAQIGRLSRHASASELIWAALGEFSQ